MNSTTLVYQSFREYNIPSWIQSCLDSVKNWAILKGFDYHKSGDEFFDDIPVWFRAKVGTRMPILSDWARLFYAQNALHSYQRVIWLDADVFLFAPHAFQLPDESYAFGHERWVQPHKKGLRYGWKIYKNVCNAFCLFQRGNSFLDFYLHACERTIHRVHPDFIAPQIIGPKFLSAIHHSFQLPLTQQLGSASPYLISDLAHHDISDKSAYHAMRTHLDTPCVALNLCHSLLGDECHRSKRIDEELINQAMQSLYQHPQGILPYVK
jgi:hypothetical protein